MIFDEELKRENAELRARLRAAENVALNGWDEAKATLKQATEFIERVASAEGVLVLLLENLPAGDPMHDLVREKARAHLDRWPT